MWLFLCDLAHSFMSNVKQDKIQMFILTLMLYCISKSCKIQVAKVATKRKFQSPKRKSQSHWRPYWSQFRTLMLKTNTTEQNVLQNIITVLNRARLCCWQRKITKSTKVPNNENLVPSTEGFMEKSKFFQSPKGKNQSPVALQHLKSTALYSIQSCVSCNSDKM